MSNPSLANLEALREELCSPALDQGHLFAGWPESMEAYTDKHIAFLTQLYLFQNTYHGGVAQYIRTGKELLATESEETDFTALEMPPLVFNIPLLYQRTAEMAELERTGTEMLRRTVFVLVAGGLGERLGSSDIKVGLPVETATDTTYLDYYLSWARQVGGPDVPFVLMTSDDTHARTLRLIQQLNPKMPNLRVLKQEQVFCFSDPSAHLAVDQYGTLLRKPHGHGDVHSLIHHAAVRDGVVLSPTEDAASADKRGLLATCDDPMQPLVEAWLNAGYASIAFLQDTNACATITIPISLAINAQHRLDMNFTCVPRLPKESVGLLCRVKKGNDEPWRVANVEYNIFAEVARTLTAEGGDVASHKSEYSPFPGNINTLVYSLPSYAEVLRKSHGTVPEFINPKYSDATRRHFKKPARIESLMQDIALLFREDEYRVGGTIFERFSYQPVKNSLEGAAALVEQGNAPYCAATGEADFYEMQRRRLRGVGVPLFYDSEPEVSVAEDKVHCRIFPIVVLDAACTGSGTLAALAKVFPTPENVRIDQRSTLLVKGRVVIESLQLQGALTIRGPTDPAAPPLVVRDVNVHNAGWKVHALPPTHPGGDPRLSEVDRIRGFVLDKAVMAVLDYTTGTVRVEQPSIDADGAKL
ncbi:UDP-sugar pyrophosphorylase (USP) [Leptomonas pyrrhocoris]|uniref:UTP-monosaccharide-1-phosphate uridylyltransferase n=1 Tax=Leptomonas pyrrhocoris TaxID=157538 RepID=A0A0M9FUF9_LEPPY|nr:UDP-sugar pyrophosphorylase (USP) [Leptomonas pyrrhocoris]KPA76253.1 UDP-sugar pyrophosphorylase (USP) [Leptomonas pyrrhocoris]|eukprot:XP_015654692.1 UDP-sugar pyrophosphorylase (USP) [Leptomonas pyrrhocoris]